MCRSVLTSLSPAIQIVMLVSKKMMIAITQVSGVIDCNPPGGAEGEFIKPWSVFAFDVIANTKANCDNYENGANDVGKKDDGKK